MTTTLDLDELDALADTPLTVTVGGRSLAITPVRVAELPAMLRACEPIFAQLAGGDVAAALLHNPDAAIAAIAVGARLSRADIDALGLDELIELGGAVLQVNADFFARRLAPAFVSASEKVAKALAGSTPSSGWSAQDSTALM